jgi:NADH-quinone oxidoreductase subunit H
VWQPLGFAIYLVAALMTTYRRPFDLPQAGSEIGGGVLAEYSGPRLLLFELSLDALFIVLVAAGTVLFLGGGRGPWLASPVWLALKTFGVAGALLWIGRQMPRLRHDQMLAVSWKVLLPASLVNVAIVGVAILIIG